ncbi:MAG: ATP-binding cassette domain-containing protein [Acidobacteriaceae bacterium]|nr:ATP-binding cassette domain-containing protein [Acidobacteriaceae bacterium]
MSYLSFENVSYSVRGRKILDRISLDVDRGETLVLLGRSGSGKTTALRLINRMLQPSSGTVLIAGEDTAARDVIDLRRRIGYVVQDFGLMPHWTVGENVGLMPRLLGWDERRKSERTRELLKQVKLDPKDYAGRYPRELSGGEKQRVGVARALAGEPILMLLDEPFGALDPLTRHDMQALFVELRSRYGGASVFVTHDLFEAIAVGTRIAVLDQGRLEGVFAAGEFLNASTPVARAFLDTLPPGVSIR